MLIAKYNIWESRHIIFDGDTPIAELKFEKCVIGGSVYNFSSHGFPYVGYDAEENGKRVALADHSVVKGFRGIVIQHGGNRYLLRKGYIPWWRRLKPPYILLRDDKEIGSLTTETKLFRTEKKTIDLPETMPIFLRVFIFWIVLDLWNVSKIRYTETI